LFLVQALGEGYGGLEHRSSTSLLCSRSDLPRAGDTAMGEGYRRFLGLCSHEYFHLWNVKRIQPKVLQDHALDREAHTGLLWFFEGATAYYDDLALVRSGCIDAKSYLELLAQNITRVMRGNGRRKQSVAESSFDAWTKFYKQDENAPNAIVSYYAKGSLVALALDILLRVKAGVQCSLDEVMRLLWQRHGTTGLGVEEDGIERLVQELSGLDLRDFFADAVHGTADPPLGNLLPLVGIELRMRAAKDAKDVGGAVEEFTATVAKPTLGLRVQESGEPVITHVLDGGAAQQVGLAAGDTLVALDGIRVTSANLESLLLRGGPGEGLELYVFRRDELMRFEVVPRPAPEDTCDLRLSPGADAQAVARREAWLHP
jgi:predicted metalloprotease with PDZ domain